ncbi:MAG TPA: maleylpyruvate isomerase family mycothiol-dependent enzyme [Acidimicrobiales bacterium]
MTDARAAVRLASERVASVIEDVRDPSVPLPGWDWTLGDVAAHVTGASEVYAGYARGDIAPAVDVSDIAGGSLARTSAAYLAAYPERDPRALGPRLRAGTAELLRVTDGRPADDPIVWNGQPITVGALYGVFLAELLLHGGDIAKVLDRPWEISADDARIALDAALPIVPLLVNPATTAGRHETFELRVRGGTRVVLRVDDGSMSVRPAVGRERVDCRVSADPVALLLIAYGRTSQWPAIATGKLLAWGRKPWIGLRLTSYLVTP